MRPKTGPGTPTRSLSGLPPCREPIRSTSRGVREGDQEDVAFAPMVRAVVGFVLVLAVSGCGAHSGTTRASPLGVVSAATPRVPLAHAGTSGTYPQVRSGTRALGAVNAALRGAIVADQRAFELRVRRRRAWY